MTMNEGLIDRLEARCVYGDARLLSWKKHDPLSAEAAAEIYHLRAEIERLRGALSNIIHTLTERSDGSLVTFPGGYYQAMARAALAQKGDQP